MGHPVAFLGSQWGWISNRSPCCGPQASCLAGTGPRALSSFPRYFPTLPKVCLGHNPSPSPNKQQKHCRLSVRHLQLTQPLPKTPTLSHRVMAWGRPHGPEGLSVPGNTRTSRRPWAGPQLGKKGGSLGGSFPASPGPRQRWSAQTPQDQLLPGAFPGAAVLPGPLGGRQGGRESSAGAASPGCLIGAWLGGMRWKPLPGTAGLCNTAQEFYVE